MENDIFIYTLTYVSACVVAFAAFCHVLYRALRPTPVPVRSAASTAERARGGAPGWAE